MQWWKRCCTDNNAGVRQEAISLLDVVKADTSVRSGFDGAG